MSDQITKLMANLAVADSRAAAANELVALVKANGIAAYTKFNVAENLETQLRSKKKQEAREGALAAIAAVAKSDVVRISEPFLLTILPTVLETAADKVAPVRDQAVETATTVVSALSPYAVPVVLPVLFEAISYDKKWQTKNASLLCMEALVESAPSQLALQLPAIVPLVSELMWETKNEVKVAAKKTMDHVCQLVSNKDIEKFIPAVIECIADPSKVPDTIHLLGATTFVQAVESPTLAIMVPLLARGLLERSTPILRKTALIVDNMCKLVDDPDFVRPFLPKMLPGLKKIGVEVSDPEACTVISKAIATLLRVAGAKDGVVPESASRVVDPKKTEATLTEVITANKGKVEGPNKALLTHVALMCSQLITVKNFEPASWTAAVVPYFSTFLSKETSQKVADATRAKCFELPPSRKKPTTKKKKVKICVTASSPWLTVPRFFSTAPVST